jgi:oligopeptide/dipeptide ABC transporter ATP-binding protein
MYLGRIVEVATTEELLDRPRHPYTRAPTDAFLSRRIDDERPPTVLRGEPPSPVDPPKGCYFHPRCPHTQVRCQLVEPEVREPVPGHLVKCHFDL